MTAISNRLRLFGLIQELQKEAADLGLTRTAAALEVTTAVAMEELADHAPPGAGRVNAENLAEEDEPA